MERKRLLLFALLVTGLLIVSYVPLKAKAHPVITELAHTPKYPHINDPLNITARVEDAVAIDSVMAFFCTKGGICLPPAYMYDPDADHVYNQTVFPDYTGVPEGDYYVVAIDVNTDQTMSDYVYVQFAKSVNATMTTDRQEVYPGGKFNLTADAHYWGNASAPVENSSVDINRVGSSEHWTAETDSLGQLTVEITAPATVGTYVYNATITNQSEATGHIITGYAEESVLVVIEPLPDLVVRPQDITYAPSSPYEGDTVTAQITVRNVGNEDETFRVLVVVRAGGVNHTLANESATLHAWNETNNSTTVTVSWDAYLGVQELNVTLDPGDPNEEASEDNNFASAFVTGLARPPQPDNGFLGLPLYVWAIIVIVLVVAVIAIALMMRRKRPESPEEPQEPNQ